MIKCPKFLRQSNSVDACYITCSNDGTLKDSIRLEWFNSNDRLSHKKNFCNSDYKECNHYDVLEDFKSIKKEEE